MDWKCLGSEAAPECLQRKRLRGSDLGRRGTRMEGEGGGGVGGVILVYESRQKQC